jgi:hypothetical protein
MTGYNYPRFHKKYFDFSRFPGPKPGEDFLDFELYKLDGGKVRISDFLGKFIVLETGAYTCPQFVSRDPEMRALQNEFPEAVFLVMYIREAHPAQKIHCHVNLSEKIKLANALKESENEQRQILVDDLEGSAHKAYGEFPNMLYVINKKGKIAFRSDWNNTVVLKEVLNQLRQDENTIIKRDLYPVQKPSPKKAIKVLLRGGFGAITDIFKNIAGMLPLYKARWKLMKEFEDA